MQEPLLTRRRARDEVQDLLRAMIAEGALPAGARLEEEALSDRIGVSRTPLREALIALEGEGLVQSWPNRGVSVVSRNEALVRDVFPILAGLESTAMRLAGQRLVALVPRLRDLNGGFGSARQRVKQYELDAAFHRALTSECGNARLLKLLASHRDLARLFDGAHRKGAADQQGSHREHGEIIAAIEEGHIDKAADLVIAHWRRGEDVVATWLRDNP